VITFHEFAHGITCKHFGGSVRDLGFMLIYFQPAFYCNVSDAWLFPEKRKRLWVTAAGGRARTLPIPIQKSRNREHLRKCNRARRRHRFPARPRRNRPRSSRPAKASRPRAKLDRKNNNNGSRLRVWSPRSRLQRAEVRSHQVSTSRFAPFLVRSIILCCRKWAFGLARVKSY